VPQGSVLGPLFFLLYINDINSAIKSSYHHLYADDTIIIGSENDKNTLIKNIEQDLLNLQNWLSINKLTPNEKKCESIFFGNPLQLKQCSDLKVKFNGETLETKNTVKYLGVNFDSTLSWKKHISYIKGKINFKLNKIRPLAKFIDTPDTFMLVRSLIFPYIHYCSTTWFSAAPYQIRKLQSTLNKIQLFSPQVPEVNVQNRLNLDLSLIAFKIIHDLAPSYLNSRLEKVSNKHHYNTRQSENNNLYVSHSVNKFSTKSIKHNIPRLWNSLPTDLKNEKSLSRFKGLCKNYFL